MFVAGPDTQSARLHRRESFVANWQRLAGAIPPAVHVQQYDMACAVDGPLFDERCTTGVAIAFAGIGSPQARGAALLNDGERRCDLFCRVRNDLRAVDRVHRGVAVAMKGDHRHEPS